MRIHHSIIPLLVTMAFGGCFDPGSDATTGDMTCPVGEEGCRCFDNGTCFGALQCIQQICLPPMSGTSGGPMGMTGQQTNPSTSDGVTTAQADVTADSSSGSTSTSASTSMSTGASTSTTGTGVCMGTLDFNDDLGVLGSEVVIGGVQFTSNNDTEFEIRNPAGDWADFQSRWLFMWTYDNGARLTFDAPIGELHFDAGGYNPVATTTTVNILSGGQVIQTVETVQFTTVPVDVIFDMPTNEIEIVFDGGSVSTFGIDNLAFDCP